jgi:hypothetical protein
VLVPPTLHEALAHLAVLIHGPPPIVTFAMNGEEDLIERPLVTRLGAPATELIGRRWPELPAPLSGSGQRAVSFDPSLHPPRWDRACDFHRTRPPPERSCWA